MMGLCATLGVGPWLTHKNKPLPICYHVIFGSSVIKCVRINKKEPQIWGVLRPRPLGVGRD